jgi:hypothetical protein
MKVAKYILASKMMMNTTTMMIIIIVIIVTCYISLKYDVGLYHRSPKLVKGL